MEAILEIKENFAKNDRRLTAVESRLTKVEVQLFEITRKINEIDERTQLIPKLYDNVDKVLGEIIENRQERAFINSRLDNHEHRIKTLER